MVRKIVITGITTILVMFIPSTEAQDFSVENMINAREKLLRHFTPEDKEEIEKQHKLYFQQNPVTPLKKHDAISVNRGFSRPLAKRLESSISRVLLMINNNLYSDNRAKSAIDCYAQDICNAYGCAVEIEILSGGSPSELKGIIKEYYTEGGLDGVVKIGQFTPAMFFDPDPQYGGDFACDLFYMDLNGSWSDDNNDGRYETHVAGSGDRAPEIFLGRIDAATMGSFGTEVDLLCRYLEKNHNYWIGNIPLKKSAYVHLEHDWQNSTNEVYNIYGEENTGMVRGTATRDDWAYTTLATDYSFIHLWCHAGWSAHYFHNGGELTYRDIWDLEPKPIAYVHDGCHVADWVASGDRGYVVGSYVFSNSPTSLVVISGTKTGQWIGLTATEFFERLGENDCIGEAYKKWFGPYINSVREYNYQQVLAWDYGYCIIGDPMISMISVSNSVSCSLDINISGQGTVNKSPEAIVYGAGAEVSLTAVAKPGWFFSSWEGDISSESNPADIVMTSTLSVTANFTEMPEMLGQKLTIEKSDAGSEYSSDLSSSASCDQDTTTRWLNNSVIEDSWIEYDLGSNATVKTVRLMLNIGQSRKIPLKIEVGNGETFQEVWNSTTYLTNGFQNINLPEKTQGRYVRISMTGENSDETGWFSIVETEIWGDNLTGIVNLPASVMESLKRNITIGSKQLIFTKSNLVQEIALYNTAGRVLLRQNIGKSKQTVHLNHKLVPGSYILRVKINGIFRTGRIMVSD